MSARLLILCPGQGGQHAGMFEMARAHPGAVALLDRCQPQLGDSGALFENRVAQPAIVAATLAMWEALRERMPRPALVAGYSIGELSAYGVAGAFGADQAVRLATIRARLMDEAADATAPQALAAIGAIMVERARQLAQAAGFEIAIVTGDDSCIAGGLQAALPALETAVRAAGGRLQTLPVRIASHTSLMSSAAAPFAQALLATPFQAQSAPVLSGISAARIMDKQLAAEHLSRQLCETVAWSDCMDAAAEAGVTVALELGPGAALARMLQARHPGIACRSAAEFRSLDGVLAWLRRHLE